MRAIAIVGAGAVGSVLAKRLVRAGHRVSVANSRGRESLTGFAQATGAVASDLSVMASGADILIIAIPLGAVRSLPKALLEALPPLGVVVDTGNYVPPRDGAILEIDDGLTETEWTASQLGAPVVKAFNNITSDSLEHKGRPPGARRRIALPVNGDAPKAREIVMDMIEELGFTAFDAGPLRESWRQQIGQSAFSTDPDLSQLERMLKSAKRESVGPNRDNAMAMMTKMPSNFPAQELVRAARFMAGLDRLDLATWFAVVRLGFALATKRR